MDDLSDMLSRSSSQVPSVNDSIDLSELFLRFWLGKWWIMGITSLFAVVGVIYALSLPNIYKSEGIYAPSQKERFGGAGRQLGGIASLAGLGLSASESNDLEQAIALLTSWPFLEKVINLHNLKPLILGVKGWNQETEELVWDEDVYDPNSRKWVREPPPGKLAEPSGYEAYRALSEMLEVNLDRKVNMVTIAVRHYSPEIAREWVEFLVEAVNAHFQLRDMTKATKSIEYLQIKASETSISQMQAVFYSMIEAHTKTLMLTEIENHYLLSVVVEPMVAELRSSPKRALIVFLCAFLGGILALVFVTVRGLFRNSKFG